jgi:sugar lactone lactonase YvrE
VDRSGRVFFVIAGSNVVTMLEPNGRVRTFAQDDRLRLPHHLVLGRDGALYVASDHDGRVWRVGENGALTEYFSSKEIWNSRGVSVGSGGDPFTVDSAGNIYALAAPNGQGIVRITNRGEVTDVAKRARFGPLHFSTMTVGPDGALYLTDGARVWRIVGDSAVPIVPRGVSLLRATGVAVDSVGNIYVADYGARRVVRFARDGSVNTPAAFKRMRLGRPTGVVLAANGDLYVLDNRPRGAAIWRVRGEISERLYGRRDWQGYAVGLMIGLLPLLLAIQTWLRKPKGMTDWLVWTLVAGVAIVGMYWIGRVVPVFSWLRHLILAIYAFGAWKSYQRMRRGLPLEQP